MTENSPKEPTKTNKSPGENKTDSESEETKVFVINTPKSNEMSPLSKLEATQREEIEQEMLQSMEQTQRNDSFLRDPISQKEHLKKEKMRRKNAKRFAKDQARIRGEPNNRELIRKLTEEALEPPKSIYQTSYKSEKLDSELNNFKFPSKLGGKEIPKEVEKPRKKKIIDILDTLYNVISITEQIEDFLKEQKLIQSMEEKSKEQSPATSPSSVSSKETLDIKPHSEMILQCDKYIAMNSTQKTFSEPWKPLDVGKLMRDTTLFVSVAHKQENSKKLPGEMKKTETKIQPESLVLSEEINDDLLKFGPHKNSNSPS